MAHQQNLLIMNIVVLFYKFETFHIDKEYLLIALANRGHNITVITSKKIEKKTYPYQIVSYSKKYLLSGDWLKKFNFDILFVYHIELSYIELLKKAKSNNIKIIVKSDHQGIFPLYESEYLNYKVLNNLKKTVKSMITIDYRKNVELYFEYSDFILMETSTAYRRFCNVFFKYHHKFRIISYGFDFGEYIEYEKFNEIIAIGRWDDIKQKRINRLLEAFVETQNKFVHYKLNIVGKCDSSLIDKYSSNNGIIFHQKKTRQDIDEMLKHSKVLVMSSEWESFGYVLTEALAKNNTITSTPHVGAIDVAHGFELGLVSPDFSAKKLSETMIAEISLWENNQRVQSEIFDKAKNSYDWNVVIPKIEGLFNEHKS